MPAALEALRLTIHQYISLVNTTFGHVKLQITCYIPLNKLFQLHDSPSIAHRYFYQFPEAGH